MSTLPGIVAQTPAEPHTRTARDWRDVLYPLLVVAALAAAWQAAAMLGWLRPIQFPPPSKLATSFVELMTEGAGVKSVAWEHTGSPCNGSCSAT